MYWNITCSLFLFLYREVRIFDIKKSFLFAATWGADPTYLVHICSYIAMLCMCNFMVVIFQFHRFLFQCCKTNLRYLKFVKTSLHGQFWQIKHRARVGYLIDASQKNLSNCMYKSRKSDCNFLEIGGDQGIDYIRRSSKLIFCNLKVWGKEYFLYGELLSWIRFLSFDFLHFGGAISRFHAFYLIRFK